MLSKNEMTLNPLETALRHSDIIGPSFFALNRNQAQGCMRMLHRLKVMI